mmetsp:Transcript_30971/g.62041  ORF Transcript_30971/g.62041 Transcript_30971/m.62041 type:complete len:236 (+) Transcript_30971:271-978(+)
MCSLAACQHPGRHTALALAASCARTLLGRSNGPNALGRIGRNCPPSSSCCDRRSCCDRHSGRVAAHARDRPHGGRDRHHDIHDRHGALAGRRGTRARRGRTPLGGRTCHPRTHLAGAVHSHRHSPSLDARHDLGAHSHRHRRHGHPHRWRQPLPHCRRRQTLHHCRRRRLRRRGRPRPLDRLGWYVHRVVSRRGDARRRRGAPRLKTRRFRRRWRPRPHKLHPRCGAFHPSAHAM